MQYLCLISLLLVAGFQAAPVDFDSKGSKCVNVGSGTACVVLNHLNDQYVSAQLTLFGIYIYSGNIAVNGQRPICGTAFGQKGCFEFHVTPLSDGILNICTILKLTISFIGTSSWNLGCIEV